MVIKRGSEKAALHQVVRTAKQNRFSCFCLVELITADASF